MAEGGRAADPLEDTSSWPAVSPDPAGPGADSPVQPEPATAPPPEPASAPPAWSAPLLKGDRVWTPGRTRPPRTDADGGGRVLGVILIVVGTWLLLRRYLDIDSGLVLPIIAIAIGGMLLASGLRPRGRNG